MSHGTRHGYVRAGCRCTECRAWNAAAQQRYRDLVKSRGGAPNADPLVDGARARAHVGRLRVLGVGLRAIHESSDVAWSSVVALLHRARIRQSTERRILALDAGAMANGHHVPSGPARAAMRGLVALGFRNTEVARLLGSEAKTKPRIELWRARCRLSTQRALERLLARARRGEVSPLRPPPRRVLKVRARVPELLELRRRGVELRAGEVLEAELAELRRMKRAS